MDIVRQSVCLIVYPITVYNYDFLSHDGGSGLILSDGPDVKL